LATILPAGYPEAVNAGYGSYTGWQFTSMVFSSAAGVLSTQALLHAVGLGSGAIPLAAALNWVIKDGLGQLGGVIFSSMVSTRFDANPKLWRMVSALALDASTALELLSPFFPGYFVALASVANVGKNVSFLAASASRAAIHNAFAKRENLADITGKAGSQVIISSMAGMGLGIALAAVVGSEWTYVAPTAAILCFGHLTSTYQCLRPVVLPTIDSQRLELILDAEVATGAIPQPAAVSAHETIFLHPLRAYLSRHKLPSLVIGAQVSEAICTSHELQALWDYATTAVVDNSGVNSSSAQRSACVYLLLLEGATSATVLEGARHAYAVRKALVEQG
ncbi:vitamin B6 photo-protection and homoeostasis-domain-containing protein, partial [Tribonema minus]